MSIYTINQLASILHLKPTLLCDLAQWSDTYYCPYYKKKRREDGIIKIRTIDNPDQQIKSIQKIINHRILEPAIRSLPPYMHGARPGKNITTSVKDHVGQPAILTLDIENCYPNIKSRMVYNVFHTRFGYSRIVSTMLTKLTTYQGHLPQGSPTSSSLCNLVLEPLVTVLYNLGLTHNVRLSHFIDDLYFSGKPTDICKIKNRIITTIRQHHFNVNNKTNMVKRTDTMKIANIIVNKKVSIGHKKKHELERAIMKLTQKDLDVYNLAVRETRKAQHQHHKIPKCKTKIHTLKGQIANVFAINREQGLRLQQKLDTKLQTLD